MSRSPTAGVFLGFVLAWASAQAGGLPSDGRFYLCREGTNAVAGDPADPRFSGSVVCLERVGGKWVPVFSGTGGGREALPFGLVQEDKSTSAGAEISVTILSYAEGRAKELRTASTLIREEWRFAVDGENRVTGTWKARGTGGTAGNLRGLCAAMRATGSGAAPLGEHPRFLFRKSDLPALKKKFQTPWGQALVKRLDNKDWSRSNSAVGLGLLYQLTGDRSYADRARELIRQDIDSGWWLPISGIHDPGHKAVEGCLAYDLIYDACDAAFREKMRALFRGQMQFLENYCDIDRGNGHDHSNWSAQLRAGMGMVALSLTADPSDLVAPSSPIEVVRLAPPAGFRPGDGVPVLPRDGRKQMDKWLAAGPFDIGLGNDGLASLGGAAKARPSNGTTFPLKIKAQESKEVNDKDGFHLIQIKNARFSTSEIRGDDLQPLTKDATGTFGPVPAKWMVSPTLYVGRSKPPVGDVDLRVASGYRSYRTFYFYAVLENAKPCYVQVLLQHQQRWDPCVYIAGRRFEANEVLFLEAGQYPVMIPTTMTSFVWAHGRDEASFFDFGLREVPAAYAEDVVVPHRRAVRDFRAACVETLRALDPGGKGADPEGLMRLARARMSLDRWCSHAIGDRGWNSAGECYTRISLMTAFPFAHAYRNSEGRELPRLPNIGWILPQAVCRTVFSPDGARMQSIGRGGGPLGVDTWARGLGFVPENLRPAVLWGWKRTQQLAEAGKLSAPEIVVADLDPMSAAFLFVTQPLEIPEKDPDDVLPRVVADTQRIGYTMRNRWQDGDDIVTLFTGWRHPGGDWADGRAGELRLLGLGAEWIVHAGSVGTRAPTIWGLKALPDTVRERYLESRPDGSGEAAIEFLDEKTGKAVGSRHVAVDYSGACGAPALIVVADRIPPPPADAVKRIRDALRGTAESAAPAKKLDPRDPAVLFPDAANRWELIFDNTNAIAKTDGGFVVKAPNGATLAATVASPAPAKVRIENVDCGHEINYWHDHRNLTFKRQAVSVPGQDFFFVVMTLQKGEAPKVTATVQGTTARATVGTQVVSFDGERLRIGRK